MEENRTMCQESEVRAVLEEYKHALQKMVQHWERTEDSTISSMSSRMVWPDRDQLHVVVAMLEWVLGEGEHPAQMEENGRRKLTGRDLQEAFLVGHTGMSWDALHISTKITYEMTAQALNITLGLMSDTELIYLLAYEDSLFRAGNPEGLAYRISQQIHPGDIFRVVIIQGGQKVGHGQCQMLQDQTLWKEEEWEGLAQDLALNFNALQRRKD